MSKHEDNSQRQNESHVEDVRPSRHEEGSSWARTPEVRAQEGVEPPDQPSEDTRNVDSSIWESQDSSAAPAVVPLAVQSHDPYASARYDTYGHHQYDDYFLRSEYYSDEYYPSEYDIYRQTPYADYYRDSSSHYDYATTQSHNPAASFAVPASAFVATVPFARDYAHSVENTAVSAAEYVSNPEHALVPGAEAHLDTERSVIPVIYTYPLENQPASADGAAPQFSPVQTDQVAWSFAPIEGSVHDTLVQHKESAAPPLVQATEQANPELVYHLSSYVNKPEYPLVQENSSTLYSRERTPIPITDTVDSPTSSPAFFLCDEVPRSDYAFASYDSFRQDARTREAEASDLVSGNQSMSILDSSAMAEVYAQPHPVQPVSSSEHSAVSVLAPVPQEGGYAQWQAFQPILQEWHNHANVLPDRQVAPDLDSPIYGSSERSFITAESKAFSQDNFLHDEISAGEHTFVAGDAYRVAAQTREAEASSLVADNQVAAVLGTAPAAAAYGHAHGVFDDSRSAERGIASEIPSDQMTAEQVQALHSYLNGSGLSAEQVISVERGVGERSVLSQDQSLPLHSVQIHGHAPGHSSLVAEDGLLNHSLVPVEGNVLDGTSAMVAANVLDDSVFHQIQNHGFIGSQLSNEHYVPGTDSQTRLTVNRVNRKEGFQNLDGLLVEPEDKHLRTEGLLFCAGEGAKPHDGRESLTERTAVDAVLLNGQGYEGRDLHEAGRGHSDGKESGGKLKTAGAVAGAVTLGALGFAGHVAVKTGKTALGITELLIDQGLREDEDLKRVADTNDIVHDAADHLHAHMPSGGKDLLKEEFAMERMLLGSERLTEKQLSLKNADAREVSEAVDADGLFAGLKGERALVVKPDGSEKVSSLLIGEDGDGETGAVPSKEKRPVTKRERELAKKKADKLAAKRDSKHSGKALEVVKDGGKLGMKGALVAGGLIKGSTKKVLASRDEEIATAMTMVKKGKQTVRGARTLVKLPARVCHLAKTVAMAVVNTVKSLWHGAVALVTGGSGLWVPLAGLLFLLLAVVVIILATATIVNEEQEISEITALIAELDEDLTEEINSLGARPILYADANDTYGMKDDDGDSLTIDADLGDEESDLKEVLASTVTVRTNAEAVAAYIDAKYSGDWQVGAASWKVTVDAFGKSWNLIEWDDMPEWARDALNATDQLAFGMLLQEALKYYVDDVVGLDDLELSNEIAKDISTEMTRLIYDEQIQGINEDVITEVVKKTVKKYREDLDVTDEQATQIYYHMNAIISEAIAEYEPVAMVYDEVVELHKTLNYWSQEYKEFEDYSDGGAGAGLSASTGASDVINKYGYPNSRGYNAVELANWDGYNEVSVYGISEAGTTAVTADGTTITNTWNDTTMGIACEGLQNDIFAYWSPGYKAATGLNSDEPVKITLYNPDTGKSVTAEVIDCGGWRGFNSAYAGMNADRQWDLLPAVWKALGGGTTAGTMHVYWRVDPDAVVGLADPDPITIEGYPWEKETDDGDGEIEITRPAYIAHGVQDLLNNSDLLDEVMNRESYPSEAVYKSVKSLIIGKVQGVMKTLLAMENSEGDTYIDYLYLRRNLADPFGKDADGEPVQWVVTHRFNPGYEDFEHDDAYVKIKPLSGTKTVKAVLKGEVEEVKDGTVIIRSYIDSANSSKIEYSNLTDVKVEEGDEVKRGTTLGKMKGSELRIKYYEINDAALQMETEKDWAYNAALFMRGFAGYDDTDEPTAYTGPASTRSIEDCETIVDFAYSRLGCPYVWGATGPDTFDCSGLTQWCYAHAGINIPRNSEAQHDAGQIVSMGDLQPGDILWKPGHVGIYIGNNQYIHAPKPGDVVKISSNAKGYFTCGLRF